MPLPTNFAEWTLENARAAIDQAILAVMTATEYEDNRTYIEDRNGWGGGRFWIGPNGGTDVVIRARTLSNVERQHIHVDTLNECLSRAGNSLLRKEADISFAALEPAEEDTPEAEAQAAAAETMLDDISAWWDRVKLWEKARLAYKRSRYSGRGALRPWLPPGLLDKMTTDGAESIALPTGLQFDEALARIHLSAPEPKECTVYTDTATQRRAAVFVFTENDKKKAELWFVDPETEDTVVRTLGDGEPREFRLSLGGRLPIAEMEAELLITESVRRQQARLNFFESLLVRVGETAGFPERYTLGAAPQGIWTETVPAGPPLGTHTDPGGKTYYLHAIPLSLGAAITTELRGHPYDTDDKGGKGITTPSVMKFDPTDPEYAIKAALHARRTILEQCKQGHVLTNSEAAASGYSREQARADYEDDLANSKPPLEGMLREIIESVIALAESMGAPGAPSFLDSYRCVVNLHIDTGPMSPEEKAQNAQAVKDGLLSRGSAMALNGVEDVAAEQERIEQEPAAALELARRQGEAMLALTTAGWPLWLAARKTGIDDETVAELKRVSGILFPEDEDDDEAPTPELVA
ncbi:MAG: hypothetical protein ACR2G6_06850 [Gemmatimonadaceae bacterium]